MIPIHHERSSVTPRALAACALLLPGLSSCIAGEAIDGLDHSAPDGVQSSYATVSPKGKQLALGRAHGCSLDPKISGVLCWGDNLQGQTDVPRLVSPTFIAAGGDLTCAVASDRLRCWGDNSRGQRSVPARLGRVSQVAIGGGHVCALTAAGAVRCWGDNSEGQLTPPPSLRDVKLLAAGQNHTCALTSTGVTCWGDSSLGQLEVPELVAPKDLAVGGSHACVIDAGRVLCWGGDNPAVLEQIPEVTEPKSIATSAGQACVIDAGGVQCWGDSATDLTPPELNLPEQLALGGSESFGHACARHLQGVRCWGDDSFGQTRYNGEPLHVLHHSAADIAAPPELVWDILMDLESYPEWNPYTIAMRSTLKVGDPMIMTVKMNALLTLEQTEHIRVLEPGHKVCWGINTTTPEFNSGERCQWLEELPDGGTRYITQDLIEGTANPLVSALFGNDVQVGFDGVARALKARAEALQSGI